jgi:hypothetical protein
MPDITPVNINRVRVDHDKNEVTDAPQIVFRNEFDDVFVVEGTSWDQLIGLGNLVVKVAVSAYTYDELGLQEAAKDA